MATLAPQAITRTGLTPSFVAATGGGDKFLPGRDTFLAVKNGGGSAITVTIVTPNTNPIGLPVDDVAVSVAAGAQQNIGPFPADYFADPSDGLAHVTYSAVTSVTVAVQAVTQP